MRTIFNQDTRREMIDRYFFFQSVKMKDLHFCVYLFEKINSKNQLSLI